ncbi:hypothetical protein SERLA73DRAFT_167102 [Serpula lacrymans var. lacrymans S7.3]|uniref:Halogenase n=2 Tax=Serpula lacrymans var. lacrymans TaxID=341189 RepID=F8PT54_SERL3|nr:putative halogenase [Serpula lacrymans var. lacrymans S7.9]EGO00884.1 hypothetical protein SERLA73DRAFT_167102 [Serpula lacrymans var. lacrymans S7.3]EGO26501.1 putative halogenase [Serpula lacrymans var. lacrymans S7.9]
MSLSPPVHIHVLVVGGGPAGSYAASVLAREGISVAIIEAATFPRYHVGESLIPSVRHYLRFIDAEQKLVQCGFKHKPGSAIKFNQFKREGYTDFVALGHSNSAWNVVRSEFDLMLLNHAKTCNAHVFENTRVKSLRFSTSGSEQARPIAAEWVQVSAKGEVVTGVTSFEYLVDATGRAGLMSTKYLINRHFNTSLKNIAIWGYWSGAGTYGIGTSREGSPWFEALTDESGWGWFIPLHDGTTSVGIVMNQQNYNDQSKTLFGTSLESRYRSFLPLAPNLYKLIGDGVLSSKLSVGSRSGEMDPIVRSASDFSYSAREYAGVGFRIAGDAGAFIDPFFSSGVHLALTSALSAAATICAALRGDCAEAEAAAWHTKRFSMSYTRFQVVVLSAYKQIRAQSTSVLNDVGEDGYDRAFAAIRPVIQGASDMGTRLSEEELQRSLDFCVKLFSPTSPEQRALAIQRGLPREFLDVTAPIIDPIILEAILAINTGDSNHNGVEQQKENNASETSLAANQVNARRVVHCEYAINNMEEEVIDGFVVRLQIGKLGLRRG